MAAQAERSRVAAEYARLKLEYQNMEALRQQYSASSLTTVSQQRDLISKLRRENETLQNELDLEMRFAHKVMGPSTGIAVSLHDQLDLYVGKQELELKSLGVLREQVDEKRRIIFEQTREAGGSHAAVEQKRKLQSHVRVLKKRLEARVSKFDDALARTRMLRSSIDQLKQERGLFDDVHARLKRDVAAKHLALAVMVEAANEAYEARDAADMEIARIQLQLSVERNKFDAGIVAVHTAVDAEVELARREIMGLRGELTMDEESSLKDALHEGQRELAHDADAAKKAHARVRTFEATFTKLKGAKGVSSIAELEALLLLNEEATFRAFELVAAQGFELQDLEEKVYDLRRSANLSGASNATSSVGSCAAANALAEKQRARLNALQDALTLHTVSARRSEVRLMARSAMLGAVTVATQEIFIASGASALPGANILGASGTLGEAELIPALSYCELAAADLLSAYAALEELAAAEQQPKTKQLNLVPRIPKRLPLDAPHLIRWQANASIGTGNGLNNTGFDEDTCINAIHGSPTRPALPHRQLSQTVVNLAIASPPSPIESAKADVNSEEDSAYVRPMTSSQIRRQTVAAAVRAL